MQYFLFVLFLGTVGSGCSSTSLQSAAPGAQVSTVDTIVPPTYLNGQLVRMDRTEQEWKQLLSPAEYHVLREEGTERAFTGNLWNNHEKGTFICAACGLPLFHSDAKFESGTGWPSFFKPIDEKYVKLNSDNSYGMTRTEVECARCGGHQGHVFDDGPPPTGLRYCINSVSLDFVK